MRGAEIASWNYFGIIPDKAIWEGGPVIYGGVLGGFLTAVLFCKIRHIPLLHFLDLLVPSLVMGQAIGRWGNFFYESMWNLCLLIIMLFISREPYKKGGLLCLYCIGYGLGRFLIEGLRADSLYIIPGLRVSQLLSLVMIVAGGGKGVFNVSFHVNQGNVPLTVWTAM